MTGHQRKASTSSSLDTRYKIFSADNPTRAKKGGGSILYIKNALNPMERKATATSTAGIIIQVDINPKNEVHIDIVLICTNTTITAADDVNHWKKSVNPSRMYHHGRLQPTKHRLNIRETNTRNW